MAVRISGALLRSARAMAGLSQATMAKRAILDRKTIITVETKGGDFSPNMQESIRRILGVLTSCGVEIDIESGAVVCPKHAKAIPARHG